MKRWVVVVGLLAACHRKHEEASPPAPTPMPMHDSHAASATADASIDARVTVAEAIPVEPCAVRANELIYVVDHARELLSFDPALLPADPFHLVGDLRCGPSTETPYSMAIDRNGIAWVQFHGGRVAKIRVIDGACLEIGQASTATPYQFGMGYVSDGPKAKTETLFVAQGYNLDSDGTVGGAFGSLAVGDGAPVFTKLGERTPVPTYPWELTGTGDGHLYAFAPGEAPVISEVDKRTGALVGRQMRARGAEGHMNGWAVAHWGGVFYVFASVDATNDVIAVDRATGTSKVVLAGTAYQVTGAGVSTCAPLAELPE